MCTTFDEKSMSELQLSETMQGNWAWTNGNNENGYEVEVLERRAAVSKDRKE